VATFGLPEHIFPPSPWLDKYPRSIIFALVSGKRIKQVAGPLMSRKLSLKLRYAIALILLGLLALNEAHHPFPSFRLPSFILAFLALSVLASLLRSKLRDGLVVLASLAAGFSIVEPAYQPICPPCRRALFLLCSLCWMRGA